MTNSRFVPSAGLLLAIAACSAEFAVAVPPTVESITSVVSSWSPERERERDPLTGPDGPDGPNGQPGDSDSD
mgnify:CR=1 FL=1